MKEKEKKSQIESNILVAIRVRPLNQKQISIGDWDIIRTQDNLIIILDPVEKEFEMENKKMLDVLHRSKEQRYAFDKIYRDETSEKIYQQTAKSLIKTVVTGKNATVFAYGPTGTGKTYTMLGNQDTYGLNVLAIRDIFHLIEEDREYDYTINITYVEIYNEMIRDLLVPTSGYLELRDDSDKGIMIAGVTEFKAESTEQVMNLLMMGNKRRTTQATNANQTSSRSHAVFQINVIKTPRTKNINVETMIGKLSLIDLAGSQRGTVTQNRGIRLMEGAKINRSLLALANCINALGDRNKKGFFVPYRDSKLTRLLKDSLGGNCKTVMIANICPASSQFEETINTLKYANRAKNIKTKAITNKKLVSIHISEYKNIINDLRKEIEQLKMKLQKNGGGEQIQGQYLTQSNTNQIIPNTNQLCTCGKVQQSQQIKKIKQLIFQNFNERIQLRHTLMQIQQQNAVNILEIRKKQRQMAVLKKSQMNEENMEQIKSLTKTIHTLKLSTQKNTLKKEIINLQLMESMMVTKKLKQEIPKRIKSKENRQFLEIIIKNHVLQLQNLQLEINLQLQQNILVDLKNISDSQRKSIGEKGIDLTLDDIGNENEDIELQIEDDQQNEQNQEIIENNGIIQTKQIGAEDEKQAYQQYLENQLIENKKKVKNKREYYSNSKITEEDEDKLNKMKSLDQNSNNTQLGVFGINNAKKKQKITVSQTKLPAAYKNSFSNPNIISKDQNNSDNNLDLNLKGINVKLNQKLPFPIITKEKKKK